MARKKTKEIPLWAQTGHRQPVTRRELLAAGILPFAASLIAPNWLQLLLTSKASAAEAACPAPETLIPFVSVNLQGGGALGSNFLPMNSSRQPIATYNKMGLGNNQVPIEREFGNVPFAGLDSGTLLSKFLVGVRAAATADTLSKTAFIGIPCESTNDSPSNKFDVTGLLTKAGSMGSNFPNLGSRDSLTGLNTQPAIIAPPAPLVVSNFDALANSIGFTASVGSSLNKNQKESLAKLAKNLNASQSRKLASITEGSQVKTLLECAGIKNVDVIKSGSNAVDPRQNANFSQVWGINTGTASNNQQLIFGSMVYNSLLSQAGPSSLELGGYDYHNNTRTTGDGKDQEAGTLVGRVLQSAAVLGKPVFIYVTSDGSVFSTESEARNSPWQGDRGSNGVAYLLYFNPNGRPATSDYQIGHFTDNQAADTTFVTGANPEAVGAAVFANWCQANKRMELFQKVAGRALDTNQLLQVIKFT